GTFRAVDVEDLTKHKMDSENFIVGTEAVNIVNKALDDKNKVCAIGTTTMRSLESAVSANNRLKEKEGWTDKFIFPPYDFKICNALITNFHQSESTLLMMSAAFGGYDAVMKAYEVAKKEKYKFLTYGDAMLIL
ncbi:MAG: S-adenosylmethionine:tRNA ribosyltransferase-isomerase, partial [Flammeovirgaceae bacterium]